MEPAAAQAAVPAVEAEVALRSGAAAEVVTVLSSSVAAAARQSFGEVLSFAAERTCACGPALMFAIGREAIGGVIVTAIADPASASTSEVVVGGATATTGAGACCGIVTRIPTGGIATPEAVAFGTSVTDAD